METLEAGDPRRIGPYSLTGKWGTVSAGDVFAGRSADGQVVAVTVVRPEVAAAAGFRERFRARAEAARAVSGASIMPLVGADPDAPSPWSATAVVRGLPLRRAVDQHGALPEASLRRLAIGLAEALTRIHAAGLTHGDAGPNSVLLGMDGPFVAAFGIAGTTEAGGSPADDMFGLGATVLFAASGMELEREELAADARSRIAELAAVTSTLPPSLREVIGGCLYPDPSTRPTPEQLIDYLNGQGLPVPAGDWLPSALTAEIEGLAAAPPSGAITSGTPGGGISRRNLVLGLAGGALLAAGATTAAVLSSKGPSPTRAVRRAGSTRPTLRASASASPTSTDGPVPIVLDAPDATKAWTLTGHSAPTCLEASDTVVMVVTGNATSFLDASTGKTALPALNTTNTDGSDDMTSPTTYAGGVFYYLCDTPDASNMVAAVDGTTGSVKWATAMAEQDSSGADFYIARYIAVNGNTVYVCGGVDNSSSTNTNVTTGYIRAFNGTTGKGLWEVQGTDINNVLVPPSGSHLLAASSTPATKVGQVEMIDADKRGARGWKIPTPNEEAYFTSGWPMTCYAAGVFFFVGGAGDVVIAVDAATGAEKWHQTFDADNGDQVELGCVFASLDGGTVYVPVGGSLAALNSADGTAKWIATLSGADGADSSNLFNSGLGVGGRNAQCSADTVFLTDAGKTLWAIDAATGKARWKYNDPGQPDSGFTWTVGGERVFIASNLTLTAISGGTA